MSSERTEAQTFPSVVEYLATKHKTLVDDYRAPDKVHAESCTLLACDIARLFLDTGENPYFLQVKGEVMPDGINYGELSPKIYEGRVTWGGHIVCGNKDTLYDPMVGVPMKKEDYARNVFRKPVTLQEIVSPEKIREFLERGNH